MNYDQIYKDIKKDKNTIKQIKQEIMIDMIQNGYDLWEELYEETNRAIYKIFHKNIRSIHKTNGMEEDMISILKIGWVKAVMTFDKNKATDKFIAYASYIILQQYQIFLRVNNSDRIGNSINHSLFMNMNHDEENLYSGEKTTLELMQNTSNDVEEVENKVLLYTALDELKFHDLELYYLVKLHYINNVSHIKISKMIDKSQSAVAKKIKKGIVFLQDYMKYVSKNDIEGFKYDILNAYN